jgi:hypothetical protein
MASTSETTGTETAPTGTARGREAKRLAAIALMAAGLAYDEIVSRLRVSKRSLVRWAGDPSFAAEVRHAREELLGQLTGRLAAEASATVEVLVGLRDGARSENARLGACRTLLERLETTRQQVETEARLAELEAVVARLVEQRQPAGPRRPALLSIPSPS